MGQWDVLGKKMQKTCLRIITAGVYLRVLLFLGQKRVVVLVLYR